MTKKALASKQLISAAYKANSALRDLWDAVVNTEEELTKAKLHRTYQVLALIVDQLDELCQPFD